jgi:hypothetical protein
VVTHHENVLTVVGIKKFSETMVDFLVYLEYRAVFGGDAIRTPVVVSDPVGCAD